VKFHADENVAEAVARGLRRRGFDITTTPEADLLGVSDERQLDYATEAGRVMVSHDPDMLRLAAGGKHHAGIAYSPNQKYKVGELVRKLLALARRVTPEEMVDRVEFL
jgi:uncharacterized protein with PIN domain